MWSRWIFFDRSRPIDRVETGDQLVGVGRDPEEPLRHVPRLDDRAAPPAAAVDHVLVRQHRLIVRAPLDRSLAPVGKPVVEELQEQPLGPAVERRLVRGDLAVPVDRPAHAAHLLLDRSDVALGDLERMAAFLDRRILGRQAERVEAHRPQHGCTVAAAKMRDDVAQRVVEDVPHVQLAGRIGEHLEHVEVRLGQLASRGRVLDRERVLGGPNRLPLLLDRLCVVRVHRLFFRPQK